MSTTVYRVGHLVQKNSYGLPSGPYTGPASGIYSGAPAHRPSPTDDGIAWDYIGDEWCYGFATRLQAAAWFADDAATLEAHHFAIWAVEVSDDLPSGLPTIIHGHRQIVYRASCARAVRALPVGEFLSLDVDVDLDRAEVAAEKRLAAEIAVAWDDAHYEETERQWRRQKDEERAEFERAMEARRKRRETLEAQQAAAYTGDRITAADLNDYFAARYGDPEPAGGEIPSTWTEVGFTQDGPPLRFITSGA